MWVSVAPANTVRIPITTYTTIVWALATACEPRMLRIVIAKRTRTAKALIQAESPLDTTVAA